MSTSIPLSGQHHEGDHPELENHAPEPKGVIRRNLKMQVYLGIAVLFIIATAISSLRHKPAAKQQGLPPTPMVQDSNANIEEMKRSLEAQQRQAAGPRLGNPDTGDGNTASAWRPAIWPRRTAVWIPLCAGTALRASGASAATPLTSSNSRLNSKSRCRSSSRSANWPTGLASPLTLRTARVTPSMVRRA